MLQDKLNEIEMLGDKALELISAGQCKKARRLVAKLKDSVYVTESDRVLFSVEAAILRAENKVAEARELICAHNYQAWGSRRMIALLATMNPTVGPETKGFIINVTGHSEEGVVACFGNGRQWEMCIAADSLAEAVQYMDEFCRFKRPEDREILSYEIATLKEGAVVHKGVLDTSPFQEL